MPDISFTLGGIIINSICADESLSVTEISFSSYDTEHLRLRSYVDAPGKARVWDDTIVVDSEQSRAAFEGRMRASLPDGILLTRLTEDGGMKEYQGYFDRSGLFFLNPENYRDVAGLLSFDAPHMDADAPKWCTIQWAGDQSAEIKHLGDWDDLCQSAAERDLFLTLSGTRPESIATMGVR